MNIGKIIDMHTTEDLTNDKGDGQLDAGSVQRKRQEKHSEVPVPVLASDPK